MRNFGSSYGQRITSDTTFMSKVYTWMTMALLLTGAVAMFVASSPQLISIVASSTALIVLFLIEICLVFYLIAKIDDLSFESAFFLFFLYAAINGVTLSVVFLIYTTSSVAKFFTRSL